ncbi:uncharacterized protein LOC111083743 [Limulus polyphemus]|uniref:Uncharacterized protein LOC111083743 n=1 Tax=Limulus polyphemus TaxID=6850 RepID=A0ABM1RXL1_LIMPO|nr:uncharacterized protein LOC111083743 [Limulus polyphemus]
MGGGYEPQLTGPALMPQYSTENTSLTSPGVNNVSVYNTTSRGGVSHQGSLMMDISNASVMNGGDVIGHHSSNATFQQLQSRLRTNDHGGRGTYESHPVDLSNQRPDSHLSHMDLGGYAGAHYRGMSQDRVHYENGHGVPENGKFCVY